MIEHRCHSTNPPQEEHNCEGEWCWCKPSIEHWGEDTIVIHNDIADFDDDGYYEVPSQIGH